MTKPPEDRGRGKNKNARPGQAFFATDVIAAYRKLGKKTGEVEKPIATMVLLAKRHWGEMDLKLHPQGRPEKDAPGASFSNDIMPHARAAYRKLGKLTDDEIRNLSHDQLRVIRDRRNKLILKLRGDDWTQQKVAEHVGIDRSRVSQIEGLLAPNNTSNPPPDCRTKIN